MDDHELEEEFELPPQWKAVLVVLILGIALVCLFHEL
jgi:hypothetical protein